MAYLDENDQDPTNPGKNLTSGGGGGSFGSGQTQKPTQSGSFTNLQGYLTAAGGKGADLVDLATKDQRSAYDTARSGIDQATGSTLGQWSNEQKNRGNFGAGEQGFQDYANWIKSSKPVSQPDLSSQFGADVSRFSAEGEKATRGGGEWAAGLGANVPAATGGNRLLNQAVIGGEKSATDRASQLATQWSGLGGYLGSQAGQLSQNAEAYNTTRQGQKNRLGEIESQVSSLKRDPYYAVEIPQGTDPNKWVGQDAQGKDLYVRDIIKKKNEINASLGNIYGQAF